MNDEFKVNGVTYRQRFNTCNKPVCKCHGGEKHGPYWYAFGDVGTAKYVGKELPQWVIDHAALLKSNGTKLKTIKARAQSRLDKAHKDLRQAELELMTIENLESGEYTASEVLKSLGLAMFNGHVQAGE